MREATTMNAADEYVVRDAFEALDDDKDGFLDSDQFCTLYLGLFFFPERIKKEDLLRTAGMEEKDSLISVEQALQVLQKFRRNQSDYPEETFQLLDTEGKGYIEAADLKKLSEDMGEGISEAQSKRMVSFCSADGHVSLQDFRRLMNPPENF